MTASAVANKPKRYSPMAYNKATIRRRLIDTTNRFKGRRIEEIETALNQALIVMLSEGLLPFTDPDIRGMKFKVEFDGGGTVVHLPEPLKKWLNEL